VPIGQHRRGIDALCNAGQAGPDNLLSNLSPLTWEHVNLTGDYLWEDKPAVDENGFRAIPFALCSCYRISVPFNVQGPTGERR
jgi:hypothetical protein